MTVKTHYDNLKVSRNAPPEVIKAAYKTLAQKYHPDLNPGSKQAARIMVMLNPAYAVLCDPVKRRDHDEWIKKQERPRAAPPPPEHVAPPPPPVPQQPLHVTPQHGLIPDARKARGIWWLRFCRWVAGLLLGFQIMAWLGAFYQAGGFSQYFAVTPAFSTAMSAAWTWILWYSFHEFRDRINKKHTLGYGYPHPSMEKKWSL